MSFKPIPFKDSEFIELVFLHHFNLIVQVRAFVIDLYEHHDKNCQDYENKNVSPKSKEQFGRCVADHNISHRVVQLAERYDAKKNEK